MFSRRIMIATLVSCLPFVALAETLNFRMIMSGSPTAMMEIGERLEESKNRQFPLHLRMPVSHPKELARMAADFYEDGLWGEIVYTTTEGKLAELISLSHAVIGPGSDEVRINTLFDVIDRQVFPSLEPPEDAEVLGGRKTEVQGHQAVEYIALFDDPAHGPMTARIVGVFPPQGEAVLVFTQQTVRNVMPMKSVSELSETFGGRMLRDLEFFAWRDADGNLQSF